MLFPTDIYEPSTINRAAAIFLPVPDHTGCWMNRRKESCTFPGCIQMPGGGVQIGETVMAGALRELAEETDIIALPHELKPVGLITMGFLDYQPYYMHWFCLLSDQVITPKNMETHKHDDWRVFTYAEMLHDKLIPGNYTAIKHVEWWLRRSGKLPYRTNGTGLDSSILNG